MSQGKGELLDFSNPRYWQQNARQAVRDVYDALVEIITNADDAYQRIETKQGRIEVEVERHRKEEPSLLIIRDFADGMTLEAMRKKLKRVADRVSGLAEGKAVRGTNSRGAKDVAILGGVTFESIAEDGRYHKCEITSQAKFVPHESAIASWHRERLKIPRGTGTVVTIRIDSETQVPQHDRLRQELGQIVALRDIVGSPHREIFLSDLNKGRSDAVKAPAFEGTERVNERISMPGYPKAEAKLVIGRAKKPFEDPRSNKFRIGGILIKSSHAVHESTLFAPDLEHDPHAKWFYGKLTCDYIDVLWNEYDSKREKELPLPPENSRPIFDPLRKEGLVRDHPFVSALFGEALKRLRRLVEEERKQAEGKQAKIESDETRKRLKALEKAAAKFMSEHRETDESARNADDSVSDSVFEKKGFSLTPPFAQIVLGESRHFWLNVKQEAFPEFAPGDSVDIECATEDISASKRFDVLEIHPNRAGVLRAVWKVTGEKATKATAIKVHIGSVIRTESTIEVLASEKDKYTGIKEFRFGKKRYSMEVDSKRNITLYAPYPDIVNEITPVEISCPDKYFKLSGERKLLPRPEWGVAICKLKLATDTAGRRTVLTATIPGHECKAEVLSEEPEGAAIKIELKDVDHTSQRYIWRSNVIEIAARHSSLKRYLGSPPNFLGQEEKHFRVLLAEIVAEAVCTRILSRNEQERREEYEDRDWDAYYAEYTALMTKFLPIAHDTQVKA